jgi:hypothetical protein
MHRVIMALHSIVFERMLNTNCIEGKESRLELEDISKETVDAFIRWMYCNEIDKTEQVECMYVLADKYLMDDLKVSPE